MWCYEVRRRIWNEEHVWGRFVLGMLSLRDPWGVLVDVCNRQFAMRV